MVSTSLMIQSVPDDWVYRRDFPSRNCLMLQWVLWAGILMMGYKSTLLSTLIKIRYEDTIEDLYDLDLSPLPLLLPDATAASMFGTDPRAEIQ